jgi:hypothetical protein
MNAELENALENARACRDLAEAEWLDYNAKERYLEMAEDYEALAEDLREQLNRKEAD